MIPYDYQRCVSDSTLGVGHITVYNFLAYVHDANIFHLPFEIIITSLRVGSIPQCYV
jgi:hypothetical protein